MFDHVLCVMMCDMWLCVMSDQTVWCVMTLLHHTLAWLQCNLMDLVYQVWWLCGMCDHVRVWQCVMCDHVWCMTMCDVWHCVMFDNVWCVTMCDVWPCVMCYQTVWCVMTLLCHTLAWLQCNIKDLVYQVWWLCVMCDHVWCVTMCDLWTCMMCDNVWCWTMCDV